MDPYTNRNDRPIRVLLVEDDPDDRLIIRDYLSQSPYNKYLLDYADNYDTGLEMILQNRHNVYLVDYQLGAQDGLQLLSEAQHHGIQGPLIMLTGMTGYEIDLAAMKSGAADYLVKSELTSYMLDRAIRYALAQKHSETLALRRLNFTRALNEIDRTILATHDLRTALGVALHQTLVQLNVDAAAVLLIIPGTELLEYGAGFGFSTGIVQETRLHLNESVAGRAALERRVITAVTPNEEEGFLRVDLMRTEGFKSYFGAPLIAKGEIKGVLEVFSRNQITPDREWNDFLGTLAEQIAIAVDNADLFENLQRSNDQLLLAYDTTLEGWSAALDLRDHDTEGHTQRVTQVTLRLARELAIPAVDLVQIRRGALLHDIGKMGIPDDILHKRGPLSDPEWLIMREHPVYAYRILSPIAFLRPAIDIPYCHHERWDGNGYPRQLRGNEIPLAARIFSVVDVWDALISSRPYRAAWPEKKVLEYIQKEAGKQFDPQVVRAFTGMMSRDPVTVGEHIP